MTKEQLTNAIAFLESQRKIYEENGYTVMVNMIDELIKDAHTDMCVLNGTLIQF